MKGPQNGKPITAAEVKALNLPAHAIRELDRGGMVCISNLRTLQKVKKGAVTRYVVIE
jgi:hypothetical protein